MIMLADGKRLVLFGMYDNKTFFTDASHKFLMSKGMLQKYSEQHEAYLVDDVQKCIDAAEAWVSEPGHVRRYNVKEYPIPAVTSDGWYAREGMIIFNYDDEYFELTRVETDHNEAFEVIWQNDNDYDYGKKVTFTDEEIGSFVSL